MMFAIVGIGSSRFAYSRFGIGFSVLFSSFATFLLGSTSLALFQLVVLGILILTLVAVLENRFNITHDLEPLQGSHSNIVLLATAIGIFLAVYGFSSSFSNGAASALLSVATYSLILKQNMLKIVLGLILLQCGASILMMLLNIPTSPTIAVFNFAVTGLEFFLLKHALRIRRMHGTLNFRSLRLTSRSDNISRPD